MTTAVLVDGEPVHQLNVSDRGLQFGDGLFETLAVADGRPCQLHAHIDRLEKGCRRLHLAIPDRRRLEDDITKVCRQCADGVLKIYWTAGDSARGYRRPATVTPRLVIQLSERPRSQTRAWKIVTCSHRWSENPVLTGIKHLNRLDQVLASSELNGTDCQEGLMLGQDGRVVSGTMSNLFVQAGDLLSTPVIDTAGILGVTRSLVMCAANDIGRAVVETRIGLEDLATADALYLCNSLIGIIRVGAFGDRVFDPQLDEHPAIDRGRRLSGSVDSGSPA